MSEYHWRREIPLFFPDGHLERAGVLRLPIRVRLLVTFLLTSILPLLLTIMLDLSLKGRVPETLAGVWREFVRAQLFLVGITAVASTTWPSWWRASSIGRSRRCATAWRRWPPVT